ncbi:MAG: helix-turn-helix domain-containing protein [Desulfovibrionaceae bacterium]|nr:helix-turn-helix domain-containing protein [Desulfovibrionaceae bacterium]
MTTLGERLKELRAGKTQRWLAEQLGIPQTTLSNYEKDKNEPNIALIHAITAMFAVRTDWLLFGSGPMREDGAAEDAPARPEAEGLPPDASRLERVEAQRDSLLEENRALWKANAELREKVARLEEQVKHLRAWQEHRVMREDMPPTTCLQEPEPDFSGFFPQPPLRKK